MEERACYECYKCSVSAVRFKPRIFAKSPEVRYLCTLCLLQMLLNRTLLNRNGMEG